MALRSTIAFTTGPAGSGKSFRQCAQFLVNDWLPQGDGVHYSNFPVQFERWTDANGVERPGLVDIMQAKGVPEEVVRERVKLFPDDVDQAWRNNGTTKGQVPHGPWDLFKGVNISGAHIAIDECHHYCGEKSPPHVRAKWQEWLGEIRHQGATIEFLSQHPLKVAKEIRNEAEIQYLLSSEIHESDPLLGIKNYDWYQLVAKLTGVYSPAFIREEKRQKHGKWETCEKQRFYMDDYLFGVYNSFSTPKAGGVSGGGGLHPYLRYSWPQLVAWFLWNNLPNYGWRLAVLGAVLGAMTYREELMGQYLKFMAHSSFEQKKAGAQIKATPAAMGANEVLSADVPDEVKIKALQSQLVQQGELLAQSENKRAISERDRVELANQLQEAFAVAALTKSQVTFRAGFSYNVGEVVDLGPYKGMTIAKVDYARRLCVLSDGRILRMGFGVQESAKPAGQDKGDVPEPLPATSGNGVASPPAANRLQEAKRVDGGDAVRRVR